MGLKRRQRVEPEFSLAAMIDVIFLLLCFFDFDLRPVAGREFEYKRVQAP